MKSFLAFTVLLVTTFLLLGIPIFLGFMIRSYWREKDEGNRYIYKNIILVLFVLMAGMIAVVVLSCQAPSSIRS